MGASVRWRGLARRAAVGVLWAAVAGMAAAPAGQAGRVPIRWATADVGSYGYAVASAMVEVLNRELPREYAVTVNPYPSTTAAMKAVMNGDGEVSYSADVGMRQLYDGSGGFRDYKPRVAPLVHTFYVYPMESFMTVYRPLANRYRSWADLSGAPVFFTPAGYMNWINFGRIWSALGYKFNHVEIDSSTTADAMKAGTIVAAGAYTTSGVSLPTWWREAELKVDFAILNPTAEERRKLAAASLNPVRLDPKRIFRGDVGASEIWAVPIYFSFNMRSNADPEFVYRMLTIFEKNVQDLVKFDPGFGPLAQDFVGMQVGGIKANPDIPVHPGLARFLRERGAWDPSWKESH